MYVLFFDEVVHIISTLIFCLFFIIVVLSVGFMDICNFDSFKMRFGEKISVISGLVPMIFMLGYNLTISL